MRVYLLHNSNGRQFNSCFAVHSSSRHQYTVSVKRCSNVFDLRLRMSNPALMSAFIASRCIVLDQRHCN